VRELPGSRADALDEMESDNAFLRGVFTGDALEE